MKGGVRRSGWVERPGVGTPGRSSFDLGRADGEGLLYCFAAN
jgi:hypothetical protein